MALGESPCTIHGMCVQICRWRATRVRTIDQAPLKLNAFITDHMCGSMGMITSLMVSHYVGSVTKGIYKILGSADFLGNPVALFGNVGYVCSLAQLISSSGTLCMCLSVPSFSLWRVSYFFLLHTF